MGWQSLLILTTGLLAGADAPGEDVRKIQGTWVVTSTERDGETIPPESLKSREVKMVFEGNQIIARMDGMMVSLGMFTLDSTKEPKIYDRTYPDGSPRRGIYKLEGDTLTICIGALGKNRPTEFATKSGDGCSLIVYKRETP